MLDIFLAGFDQFRAVLGQVVACLLFCRHAAPRRSGFRLRLAGYGAACLAAGFAYVPLESVLARLPALSYGMISAAYWLAVTALMGLLVYRCYELKLRGALFRVLLGCTVESISVTVLRYLIVMMWRPELPREQTVFYVVLTAAVYILIYMSAYQVLARPLQKGAPDSFRSPWTYVFIILTFQLIMYATNGICEWIVPAMLISPSLEPYCQTVRYFCVAIRFLVATAYLSSQYFVYQTNALRFERDLVNQLLREKSEQYAINRENREYIQRKSHDLKRQLRALELAGVDERRTVLEEIRRAAEFYDADIHTGYEVLDTLLTEKNLLCVNRGIRLSCAVSVQDLTQIGTVDLYTVLSNALDNAIEAVERLETPDMRTIRFSMEERGGMLYIEVENYCLGEIKWKNGFPVTSKANAQEHGIGLRSIQTLAQRYGGDIEISTEGQIFLLQIAIPLSN